MESVFYGFETLKIKHMNKEELLEELTKLAKSNNDLGKFGDGYEKAINEAIQLVKNCSIPAVVGRSEQLPNKYCPQCGEPIAQKHKYWCKERI